MLHEPKALWRPAIERTSRTNLAGYLAWLNSTKGHEFGTYDELHSWSIDDLTEFWRTIVDYYDLRLHGDADVVLGDDSVEGARWFPSARVSYPEHIFRGKDDAAVAIVHASETRETESWTWGRLRAETAAVAAGLRACGVGPGDRVCAYMPNIPETVAAFLACASLGAIWSSAAPEFGARSVVDRFAQIKPKVLIAIDGYRYGGRDFDRIETVERIVGDLPGAPRVVSFGYLSGDGWEEGFLDRGDAPDLSFASVPFDHPLWVLFSSGTTGLPKAIVHGHGGVLLEQVKHHHLHLDAKAEDRVFWFSTTGWMMWNFLVGVLLTDASIALFDGNPGYPSLDRLWDLSEEGEFTVFGTSAAFIAACMKGGVRPTEGRDLAGLRAIGSTGSPLAPEGFDWVYEELGDDVWLFSTSGGTDVCTPFVGGVPTLPVYAGEIQGRCLGVDVQAWGPDGESLTDEVGELVVGKPMPSMPVSLWGDDDGSLLHDSYFATYPGVWRHGDWIEITSRGTAIIYGRSDATINRGGIRMGTAEIYRAVLLEPEVLDALIVDLPQEGTDGWMPMFVVLRDGQELDPDLTKRIRDRIRDDCSPRHIPNAILGVPKVPRTLSGKLLEVPVKRILTGTSPDEAVSRESLADPDALDYFIRLAQESPWRRESIS
jgi:acetoacetyl-CoA synthetase